MRSCIGLCMLLIAVSVHAQVPPATPGAIDASVRRGVDYLIGKQNPDGSWGSARRTKDLNIYAPVPGSHLGFRAGTTALCVSALIEVNDPRATDALARGEAWLLRELPNVRRADATAIYNVWAHAYGIQALVRMLGRHPAPDRQAEIKKVILGQIDRLGRYAFLGGGWGYYDFEHHTQQPAGNATSFTTATVLIALREAHDAGIEVPQTLVDHGLRALRRQRKPDFTYLYSDSFIHYTMRGINRPGGSLGRSQVCNAAMRLWGDTDITDAVLDQWLNRLFDRNGWLSIGRKRPVPHESWFAVAGYFYYYGHYYAGYCLRMLPPDQRPEHAGRLAGLMIGLQEADGSWWDYPLYDYHQPYGTAMALMTLVRADVRRE